MRVSYTLAEINASNKLGNVFLIEAGTKIKIPENFKSMEEAARYFEKELESKNSNISVLVNSSHVTFVINDDMVVETLHVLAKHVPAIIGFITAVKGIFKIYKSAMNYAKEDFQKLAKKYDKSK